MSGSCISAWTTGSTLLAFGLSPQQAIGCVVCITLWDYFTRRFLRADVNMTKKAAGGIFTGLLAVACGWMGERHHIGFSVASRFSWGMRGSYCMLNRWPLFPIGIAIPN